MAGTANGTVCLDLSEPPARSSCSAGNRCRAMMVCNGCGASATICRPGTSGFKRHPASCRSYPHPTRHRHRSSVAGRTPTPDHAEPRSARSAGTVGTCADRAGLAGPGGAAAAALARAAARAPSAPAGAGRRRVAACSVRGGDLVRHAFAAGQANADGTAERGDAGAFHQPGPRDCRRSPAAGHATTTITKAASVAESARAAGEGCDAGAPADAPAGAGFATVRRTRSAHAARIGRQRAVAGLRTADAAGRHGNHAAPQPGHVPGHAFRQGLETAAATRSTVRCRNWWTRPR